MLLATCAQMSIDRGAFRNLPSNVAGEPAMAAILTTALELASAMVFLHNRDILHSSLYGGNPHYAWGVHLIYSAVFLCCASVGCTPYTRRGSSG